MIVHDFDFVRVAFTPAEAYPPLVVDADAVLPLPAAFQGFETIARRNGQLTQFRGGVQQQQFTPGATLNIRRKMAGQFRPEHPRCFRARKTQNHRPILTRRVNGVKSFSFAANGHGLTA
jgi:hypothetical protein